MRVVPQLTGLWIFLKISFRRRSVSLQILFTFKHYPKLLLGAEYPVDGEIRGELKLDGTLINLDGSANFSVTKGVAWGIHLDAFMLPLEIEDYNLNVF